MAVTATCALRCEAARLCGRWCQGDVKQLPEHQEQLEQPKKAPAEVVQLLLPDVRNQLIFAAPLCQHAVRAMYRQTPLHM
eukprot:2525644-Amphidinium_carterae.1